MIDSLVMSKLSEFLKSGIAKETLKDIRIQIHREEKYGEIDDFGSMGHSLSNYQLTKLDNRLSKSKKTLTVGQYLRKLASERGIYKVNDSTFKEANILKSYWSKLVNDTVSTHDKDKLIRIAIFLKLNLKETSKLLYKAGFTLSEENKKDEVIAFCIEEKIYDLNNVNDILVEKGLPTIFSKIRTIEK